MTQLQSHIKRSHPRVPNTPQFKAARERFLAANSFRRSLSKNSRLSRLPNNVLGVIGEKLSGVPGSVNHQRSVTAKVVRNLMNNFEKQRGGTRKRKN